MSPPRPPQRRRHRHYCHQEPPGLRSLPPGAGLQLRVHAGRAIAGGTLRFHSTPTDLILPPNAPTALWQRASGARELAAPTDPPPETTALGPLWLATTDAASVTELLDRRVFAADTVVIPLRGALPAAPDPISEALVVHDGLILEDVRHPGAGWEMGEGGRGQVGRGNAPPAYASAGVWWRGPHSPRHAPFQIEAA